MPVPGSPPPCLSAPDMREDAHFTSSPFLSFRMVSPAVAMMGPPGRTVQVLAAAADDDAAPGPRARTAAAVRATAPISVRMGSSLIGRGRAQQNPEPAAGAR